MTIEHDYLLYYYTPNALTAFAIRAFVYYAFLNSLSGESGSYSAAGACSTGVCTGVPGAALTGADAGADVRRLCCEAPGVVNVEIIDNIQMIPARVHVSFSMKSLVWRTPSTWLPPANVEERPPPFDFCTRTTAIRRIATRTVSTMIKVCILLYLFFLCLLLVYYQFPQEAQLVCKVNTFFGIIQT